MKPRRRTNEELVRKALNRAKSRRHRERHHDRVLAERRERHPETWARDRERILAGRRTPDFRTKAAAYDTRRRHTGEITLRLMFAKAKQRAKIKGVDFTITPADLTMPEVCPLLGIPLYVNIQQGAGPNSPSLDRIKPALGYVPGNVWIISYRANTIKNDATVDELERIVTALKAVT